MVPMPRFDRLAAAFALLLAAAPAFAEDIVGRASDKLRYHDCLQQAGQNPSAAYAAAEKWLDEKGGSPAEHCAAVSLVGMKRYAEAAAKLDLLAKAPDVRALRADLFDQAGNAWLLAGKGREAIASFQAALTLRGNDPDLYADLARASALQKDWRTAEVDMNAALAIAPKRADLLVLRAGARHALGEIGLARADVDAALAAKPNDPGALVERGSIARENGDLLAARMDFQAALRNGAKDEVADAARRNLAALDAARQAAKPGKR
jgi:hypothetical protein